MIENVHARRLDAAPDEVGAVIDSLADGVDDRLWPSARWPAMRFDGPLAVGTRGGHGPIRYSVAEYERGRRVAFEFDPPTGLEGRHLFEVIESERGTVLRHELIATPYGRMRFAWAPVFRPLHDALIEDSLDRAEASAIGKDWQPSRLSARVRMLRRLASLLAARG